MIALLGLSMAMISPHKPHLVPKFVQGQLDVLDARMHNVEFKNTPASDALKTLFDWAKLKYWVSPDVDLNTPISLKLQDAKFEIVLQNVLAQLGCTYRYEHDELTILTREPISSVPAPDEPMAKFFPTDATSSVTVKNVHLFMSPKQTMGGTFHMLDEAVQSARFYASDLWAYGSDGFAIVLPFETIDPKGVPLSDRYVNGSTERFSFSIPYLSKIGFSKLSDFFAKSRGNSDHDYRIIVLTFCEKSSVPHASADLVEVLRESYSRDLPLAARNKKWNQTPLITAYVYEFRRPSGQRLAVLLKPGQSKISARRHLVLAGLWSEKELR
jgi:hypothetical protein